MLLYIKGTCAIYTQKNGGSLHSRHSCIITSHLPYSHGSKRMAYIVYIYNTRNTDNSNVRSPLWLVSAVEEFCFCCWICSYVLYKASGGVDQ